MPGMLAHFLCEFLHDVVTGRSKGHLVLLYERHVDVDGRHRILRLASERSIARARVGKISPSRACAYRR